MKTYLILCFIFSILLSSSLSGQDLEEVTKEDLLQTHHPLDSTANAAYLFSSVRINYLFNTGRYIMQRLKYKYRIKVYNEAGESYGDFSIPLYRKDLAIEEISRIKAKSYNLENGKIIQQKLNKKDVYRDNYQKDITLRTFAIPNVKKGSIIDVEYEIESPFIYRIPRWFFQQYIPVDKSVYALSVPKYLELSPIAKGLHPVVVDKKKSIASSHGEIVYIISSYNIPPIVKDEFLLNEDDYRLSIKYEISESRFPRSVHKKYSDDWNSIGKLLMKDGDFGKQITRKVKELNPFLEGISGMTERARMDTIYNYVRGNFAWNGQLNKYADVGIKKLIETGEGNVADLNLLLLNLLLKSDLKAKPIVTRSRNSGLFNETFPNHTDLNYVIAMVDIEGKTYYLDASSKFASVGTLPERAVNVAGLIPSKKESTIAEIINPNIRKSRTLVNYDIDVEDGALLGKGSSKKYSFEALRYRRRNMDMESEFSIKNVGADDESETDFEFESDDSYELINTKNLNFPGKPVVLEFEELKRNCIRKIGSQIFIDAALGDGISENPFIAETRAYPIFFPSKVDELYVMNIKVPEGYIVESIPEPVVLALPEKKGRFSLKIAERGETLSIQLIFKINEDIFSATEYQGLREFFRIAIENQKEKIILKKM